MCGLVRKKHKRLPRQQGSALPAHHAHHGRQRRLKNRTSEKWPTSLHALNYFGEKSLAYAAVPHEAIIFTKFHEDWKKIVDLLLMTNF